MLRDMEAVSAFAWYQLESVHLEGPEAAVVGGHPVPGAFADDQFDEIRPGRRFRQFEFELCVCGAAEVEEGRLGHPLGDFRYLPAHGYTEAPCPVSLSNSWKNSCMNKSRSRATLRPDAVSMPSGKCLSLTRYSR